MATNTIYIYILRMLFSLSSHSLFFSLLPFLQIFLNSLIYELWDALSFSYIPHTYTHILDAQNVDILILTKHQQIFWVKKEKQKKINFDCVYFDTRVQFFNEFSIFNMYCISIHFFSFSLCKLKRTNATKRTNF